MRERPATEVDEWMIGLHPQLFYDSSIGEAELRFGVAILPAGKRRDSLLFQIDQTLHEAFEDRILPFDTLAAKSYAPIAPIRRCAGRSISHSDCQIAAVAESRKLTLVTQNTRDFTDVDIPL